MSPLKEWSFTLDNNIVPSEFISQDDRIIVRNHLNGVANFSVVFDLPLLPKTVTFNGVEYVPKDECSQ